MSSRVWRAAFIALLKVEWNKRDQNSVEETTFVKGICNSIRLVWRSLLFFLAPRFWSSPTISRGDTQEALNPYQRADFPRERKKMRVSTLQEVGVCGPAAVSTWMCEGGGVCSHTPGVWLFVWVSRLISLCSNPPPPPPPCTTQTDSTYRRSICYSLFKARGARSRQKVLNFAFHTSCLSQKPSGYAVE